MPNERRYSLRLLLSYWYYKDTDLEDIFARLFKPPYPEVFADSGAFSGMSQGVTIDIKDYAKWIKRWQHLFTTVSNLDVIKDVRQTKYNQEYLEGEGIPALPVFHTGEPWDALEYYLDRYAYIALGGMVPYMRTAKSHLMPWLIQCFKRAKGRSVFHGFGCTSWNVLKALPWYSVDSSSWSQGFRFGQVPLFDPARGVFVDAQLGDRKGCYKQAHLFRAAGFDPEDFADRKRNDRAKICAISALSYLQAETWLRRRHGEIKIPDRPDLPGLRTYMAGSNAYNDLAVAQAGVDDLGPKVHLSETSPTMKNIRGLKEAEEPGLKVHLAEANFELGDIRRVVENLK